MGSYGDNECKLLKLWQRSILKKGMHLGDNDPEKGSLGDKNNVEGEFLEHNCIIHYLLRYIS